MSDMQVTVRVDVSRFESAKALGGVSASEIMDILNGITKDHAADDGLDLDFTFVDAEVG